MVLVILVGSVLLARGDAAATDPRACLWTLAAGALGPLAALGWLVRRACRGSGREIARAESMRRLVPWLSTAAVAVATHAFGWLAAIRGAIGDLPALDELAAILPAVAAMVAATWIHWPLEQRLRALSWLDRLESGLPPWPETGRLRATLAWTRGGITLVLVPVLAVLAASEAADRLLGPLVGPDLAPLGSFAAGAAALLASPWALRWALGLKPLPPGPVREGIAAACAAHRVRLAGAYLWPTGGLVANAAILGFLPRCRFLLVSDLLLARLSRAEMAAVIEHELAHVKRRHLPWMALAVVSMAALAAIVAEGALRLAAGSEAVDAGRADLALGMASGTVALLGLGWISRRLERQADAFAAAELSRRTGSAVVEFASVAAAASALERVAELAHVDPRRPSWRHGSIRWRQGNLKALAGLAVDRLPIDRTVARIKIATLAAAIVVAWLLFRPPSGAGYDATAATAEGPSACAS